MILSHVFAILCGPRSSARGSVVGKVHAHLLRSWKYLTGTQGGSGNARIGASFLAAMLLTITVHRPGGDNNLGAIISIWIVRINVFALITSFLFMTFGNVVFLRETGFLWVKSAKGRLFCRQSMAMAPLLGIVLVFLIDHVAMTHRESPPQRVVSVVSALPNVRIVHAPLTPEHFAAIPELRVVGHESEVRNIRLFMVFIILLFGFYWLLDALRSRRLANDDVADLLSDKSKGRLLLGPNGISVPHGDLNGFLEFYFEDKIYKFSYKDLAVCYKRNLGKILGKSKLLIGRTPMLILGARVRDHLAGPRLIDTKFGHAIIIPVDLTPYLVGLADSTRDSESVVRDAFCLILNERAHKRKCCLGFLNGVLGHEIQHFRFRNLWAAVPINVELVMILTRIFLPLSQVPWLICRGDKELKLSEESACDAETVESLELSRSFMLEAIRQVDEVHEDQGPETIGIFKSLMLSVSSRNIRDQARARLDSMGYARAARYPKGSIFLPTVVMGTSLVLYSAVATLRGTPIDVVFGAIVTAAKAEPADEPKLDAQIAVKRLPFISPKTPVVIASSGDHGPTPVDDMAPEFAPQPEPPRVARLTPQVRPRPTQDPEVVETPRVSPEQVPQVSPAEKEFYQWEQRAAAFALESKQEQIKAAPGYLQTPHFSQAASGEGRNPANHMSPRFAQRLAHENLGRFMHEEFRNHFGPSEHEALIYHNYLYNNYMHHTHFAPPISQPHPAIPFVHLMNVHHH